ncbi:hypothetical protein [Amorphus sp. MBR-141]
MPLLTDRVCLITGGAESHGTAEEVTRSLPCRAWDPSSVTTGLVLKVDARMSA